MHDWMHTLFANGIVNTMVFLLFEAFIDEDRRTYKLVEQCNYELAAYVCCTIRSLQMSDELFVVSCLLEHGHTLLRVTF